jgi:hypothetical protein
MDAKEQLRQVESTAGQFPVLSISTDGHLQESPYREAQEQTRLASRYWEAFSWLLSLL